jgi:hypothetical protein
LANVWVKDPPVRSAFRDNNGVMVTQNGSYVIRDTDVGSGADLPSAPPRNLLVLDSRKLMIYERFDWSDYFSPFRYMF